MIVTRYTPESLSLIMEQLTKMQIRHTQPAVLVSVYIHFITSIVKHQDVVTLMVLPSNYIKHHNIFVLNTKLLTAIIIS